MFRKLANVLNGQDLFKGEYMSGKGIGSNKMPQTDIFRFFRPCRSDDGRGFGDLLRPTFLLASRFLLACGNRVLRLLGVALVATCGLATSAYAQLGTGNPGAATFASCSAINNQTWSRDGSTSPVVDNATITTLLDTDLITIRIAVPNSSTSGLLGSTISVGGSQIFSEAGIPHTDTTARTVNYDSIGDASNVVLSFNSTFTADSGGGTEIGVTYTISCAPNGGSVTTTSNPTKAFLYERMRNIIEQSPDRPRALRSRLNQGLFGTYEAGTNTTAFQATSTGTGAQHNIHFPLLNYSGDSNLSDSKLPASKLPTPVDDEKQRSCFDIWTEAHYARFDDVADRHGQFAVGYVGIDCQIHSAAIVGLMAQVDWMEDNLGFSDETTDLNIPDSTTDGIGWMVGPYVSTQVMQNIFFDFRAAIGGSSNDSNVAGVTGSFDTTRWLVRGELSGDFLMGGFRVSPNVAVTYMEEDQDSYVNSNSIAIDGQTAKLGQATFGPEFSRRYLLDSGAIVEPQFSLRGIWTFEGENIDFGTVSYDYEGLRGAAEAGLLFVNPDGISTRFSVKYDGLGAGEYNNYSGQVWVNIPLH